MQPTNPYSPGGIVKDPRMFFGRGQELKRIRDRLRKGDSTAVVGLRRIGKSSLLYQLAHQADALPEGTVAVYLDLQDAAHHQPLGLLASALHSLNERLNGRYAFSPLETFGDFSAAIKQITDDGFRPVLCLDEVEQLTDRDIFDDDFFNCLRSLGSQRLLAFVTASGDSLDVLVKQGGRTSKFYNIFTKLDLAGLSDEAATALLKEPFREAGLNPPPPDYLTYALELAGHYPFYLQIAAYHLFESRKDGNRILNRLALREAFLRDAESHFRDLWRHLSADEKAGVKRLVGVPATVQDWEGTCAALFRCGLAEGNAASQRLFSAVFADLVKLDKMDRQRAPRRRRPGGPSKKKPSAEHPAPPLYMYALVGLAAAVVALFVTLLLPLDRFWPFFVILTIVLTFILVLADKLTGGQFLGWLSKLLGRWK